MKNLLASAVLATLVLGMPTAAQANSTIISATIAPVRIITLNSKHEIIQIQSNTKADVTPTVQMATSGQRVKLDPTIRANYEQIMREVSKSSYGIVYSKPAKNRSILDRIMATILRVHPQTS